MKLKAMFEIFLLALAWISCAVLNSLSLISLVYPIYLAFFSSIWYLLLYLGVPYLILFSYLYTVILIALTETYYEEKNK